MSSSTKKTKETIILLPGYDGDGVKTFTKLKQLIGSKYSYLVITYPYYRQIEKSYSLSELVSYVDAKISSFNINKFHLLGFSMGGFVATSYATKYPSKITSLILISSSIKPFVTGFLNFLIRIAYYSFKIPIVAKTFSMLYTSKLAKPFLKYSPLPLPRENFPNREGYPVFGTLANVLYATLANEQEKSIALQSFNKFAILFKDDRSFPASSFSPRLKTLGFKVIIKETGGHASSPNYWTQVSKSLLRLFE